MTRLVTKQFLAESLVTVFFLLCAENTEVEQPQNYFIQCSLQIILIVSLAIFFWRQIPHCACAAFPTLSSSAFGNPLNIGDFLTELSGSTGRLDHKLLFACGPF